MGIHQRLFAQNENYRQSQSACCHWCGGYTIQKEQASRAQIDQSQVQMKLTASSFTRDPSDFGPNLSRGSKMAKLPCQQPWIDPPFNWQSSNWHVEIRL